MPFFSKNYVSSSSLPSSPSVYSTKDNNNNNCCGTAGNSGITRGQSFMHKKLERQRKLRHVSEQDLGLNFTDRPNSPPGDPDSARKSRSPGGTDHWSSVAIPHPLPVPELLLTRRRELLGSILGQVHLGSPGEGPNHVLRRNSTDHIATKSAISSSNFRQRFSQHANVESTNRDLRLKIPARSAPTSGFSSPSASPRGLNATDLFASHAATQSAKSSGNCNRVLSHDLIIEGANHNSRLITSPRSAPTSGLPSPAPVSPKRSYTGDFLPSFVAHQEYPLRSTLEIPDLGRLASHSSRVPPVKTAFSPDHSPLHSPTLKSPYLNLKNKFSFPSHHKLCQGSSKEWPESSRVSSHPLPLPPGFSPSQSMPSPPTAIHNMSEKLNVPVRKNQWVKGKLIGSGTYGRVYIGTNRVTGALCAMKEVNIVPDDPKSAECIKQLEQEIRVLRDLKHPNIVQYYGCEIVDDQFYIYLEYINPGSINKYVHEHCGHMTESIVRNFTRHILSGLAYLHSTKTVHRVIKGANLLVDASGVVKLTDFGMAKHLTGLSYDLSLKGSPHWMAPEVIKAVMLKNCNPELALAVDIWSLGCTIIEMFTGKPPWGDLQGNLGSMIATYQAQAMFKILYKDPPIPDALSPEGKDFLRRCFRRNPVERPSAMMLLEHPFVCKSGDLNVSASREPVPTVNLLDNPQRLRDYTVEKDVLQTSPCVRMRNHQLTSSSETSQQSYVYTFNCAATSHRLPCSTLEARPYLSTAQLVRDSHNFISSSNVSSNAPDGGAANNHPLAHLRNRGREIRHI
ncbi:unnamed protein product [Dovyalis caffra]|uniref:mitogen-activated protein kinase kinase kinase n=1 Tax=Dovyalis caffra TaxID=77055 RepID=A0AAV1S8L4_9ROSI|nr:unnamed protein product [Dovyalis caffra]